MEHLDEILERLMNKPKDWKDILYDEIKDKDKYDTFKPKRNQMQLKKTYNENCLNTMARMEDDFLDLTVTSPPYDKLRNYNGYSFDFESIAKELF